MEPKQTIKAFDDWLEARALTFEAVVIGGSALVLLGVTNRVTRDVDILHPEVPNQVRQAACAFAVEMRQNGIPLEDDWLNNGPSSLQSLLPPQWNARTRNIFSGTALNLRTLGRSDLLCTKLFALCDRGTDWSDCLALEPTAQELLDAISWLTQQDTNPMWPSHVRETLAVLAEKLGHGI